MTDAMEAIRAALAIGEVAAWSQGQPRTETFERAFAALTEIKAEIADLKTSVVAFGAPFMVEEAMLHGLPHGHLFPHHYDILQRAGARMADFTRGDEP